VRGCEHPDAGGGDLRNSATHLAGRYVPFASGSTPAADSCRASRSFANSFHVALVPRGGGLCPGQNSDGQGHLDPPVDYGEGDGDGDGVGTQVDVPG
jgi:hypothetical protein